MNAIAALRVCQKRERELKRIKAVAGELLLIAKERFDEDTRVYRRDQRAERLAAWAVFVSSQSKRAAAITEAEKRLEAARQMLDLAAKERTERVAA